MRHSVKAVLPMLTLLVVSCAQDLGTIDRVQHNPVAKRDILFHEDGTRKEWFVQVTTIEAPYASAYSFVGDQGPMERGVFEIQEGVLYFYRSYSFAENEWVGNPRTDVDQRLTNEDGSPYLIDGKEVWTSKNTPCWPTLLLLTWTSFGNTTPILVKRPTCELKTQLIACGTNASI